MLLSERIKKFRELDYELNKEMYIGLSRQQKPHTLFISCSDSRIDAERLLRAEPGEVFHLRNIANIVPRKEAIGKHRSVMSSVEYGVIVLGVENIVVCGHSNCGGCGAMMEINEYKEKLPYTVDWLCQSLPIKNRVLEQYQSLPREEQIRILEKLNALQQLENLMTYDFIRERVDAEKLNLYAFYYDIGTGVILEYQYREKDADLGEAATKWGE